MIKICDKNCPKRHVGCHSECPTYIEGRKKLDAVNEARSKAAPVYAIKSSHKRKENGMFTTHKYRP